MVDKILFVIGSAVIVTIIPFGMYEMAESLYASVFLTKNEVEVSYIFGVLPLLTSIWLLALLGLISLPIRKKINLSSKTKKIIGTYIPIYTALFGVVIAIIGKPLIVENLLSHGYVLERTVDIKTTFQWVLDKEVYVYRGNNKANPKT